MSVHKLITATATAKSAMSIGTGDLAENEQDHLQKAFFLLNKIISEVDRKSYEIVTVENP